MFEQSFTQLKINFLTQHNLDIEGFEDEIVYGLNLNVLCDGEPMRVVIGLVPDEQRFLFLIWKKTRRLEIIHIADLTIHPEHFQLESMFGLKRSQYLVLMERPCCQWIVVFPNPEQCQKRASQFQYLIQKSRLKYSQHPLDAKTLRQFLKFSQATQRTLSKRELIQLLSKLDIKFDSTVQKAIKQVGPVNFKKGLGKSEFETLLKTVLCKSELKLLFYKYCPNFDLGNTNTMVHNYLTPMLSLETFKLFLVEEQSIEQDSEQFKSIISQFGDHISFYEFCCFMFSETNSLIDKSKTLSCQSQNHPLTHYFVHSSHNTYLSGNQLTSDSKTSRYIQDFFDGVRCVELDIHDSWEGPIIKHGFTLTAAITFQSVIDQIAEFHRIHPNHTPIILSFENHCGPDNQRKMAQILKSKLGDIIYTIPQNLTNKMSWPTLAELCGRIVIQGTGPIADIRPSVRRELLNIKTDTGRLSKLRKLKQITLSYPEDFKRKRNAYKSWSEAATSCKKISTSRLEKPIVDLQQTVYTRAQKCLMSFYSIVVAKIDIQQTCFQMGNLSEGTVLSMISNWEQHERLVEFSKKCFVRVYPQGTRFQSSNFNPIPMYESGAQLVSLNTQNTDVYNMVMRGFFLENGYKQGGYVLKPQYLRTSVIPITEKWDLRIRVISCHGLRQEHEEKLDVSVHIGFIGSRMDMASNSSCEVKRVTEVKPQVSYQCVFREASEVVYTIEDLFFANIYFCIPGCGQISVPVRLMRTGYRVVPVYNLNKEPRNTHILVHLSLKPSKK